jgi:hypothetical protein
MPELKDEKELEDYLFETFKADGHGFTTFRQFSISTYGVVDLIRFKAYKYTPNSNSNPVNILDIEIIELKKGKIGYSEVGQILRYKRGIDRYIAAHLGSRFDIVNVSCELIGSDVERGGDFVFLVSYLIDNDILSITTFNLMLEKGITFSEMRSDWYMTNEDFKDLDAYFNKNILKANIKEINLLPALKEAKTGA